MKTHKVEFVEIVPDADLKEKEAEVTEAVKKIYPDSERVVLYRTAQGQIGSQANLRIAPGDKRRLDQLYGVVMRVLGERRGRPAGVKTVQTKVRLPQTVYDRLRKIAEASHSTMSDIVAECLLTNLPSARPKPKEEAKR